MRSWEALLDSVPLLQTTLATHVAGFLLGIGGGLAAYWAANRRR